MKLNSIIRISSERLKECDVPPFKAAILTYVPYYGLLIFLQFLLLRAGTEDASGVSGALSAAKKANFLIALIYAADVFSLIWFVCFDGYAREIYRGTNPSFRTVTGFLSRAFPILGTQLLTLLYRFLWTVLFMLPVCFVFSSLLTSELSWLSSAEFASLTQEEYTLVVMNAINEYLSACPAWLYALLTILLLASLLGGFLMTYRYRLGIYFALEKGFRPRAAVMASRYAMQGFKLQLFRLDLRFIWYHLLILLPVAASYVSDYLPLSDHSLTLLSIGGNVLLLLTGIFAAPYVKTVYAGFAETAILRKSEEASSLLFIEKQ